MAHPDAGQPVFDGCRFTRDMGCTEAELLRMLPQAMGGWRWVREGQALTAEAPRGGRLVLRWSELPARRLGLAVIPRLQVEFCFTGTDPAERVDWLSRFDLYTRRGGG